MTKNKQEVSKKAIAKVKSIRVSPSKLNQVAAFIRGMKASDALVQLSFSKKRIANDVKKCLMSAIANAEFNHGLDIDNLYVDAAHVGKGPVMKRIRARARGRAARIQKFFSHLTIAVVERDEE